MAKLDKPQAIQENKYGFPYHHLITISDNFFSQNKYIKWGYEYSAYITFILNILKNINFTKLIDIGCGDGKFLNELNKRIPGKILSGIDYSQRAIKMASAITPEINFINKDITDDKHAGSTFDIATLIETLEHIKPQEINQFIRAIYNLINSNGLLILSVPSTNEPVDNHHYQHFNLTLLKKYLKGYFKIKEVYFLNKRSKIIRYIAKALSNKYYILNHRKSLNYIYKYYKKHFLLAEEINARRICLVCQKYE